MAERLLMRVGYAAVVKFCTELKENDVTRLRILWLTLLTLPLALTACSAGMVQNDQTPAAQVQDEGRLARSHVGTTAQIFALAEQLQLDFQAALVALEGIQVAQAAVYPAPAGGTETPNVAVVLRLAVADESRVSEATAQAALDTVQAVLQYAPDTFSVLFVLADQPGLTVYRQRPGSGLWTETVLDSVNTLPLPTQTERFFVSFRTEWRVCPQLDNDSCPALADLPGGVYISAGPQVRGGSVAGSDTWYQGSLFGVPVYVPFTRVTSAS